jgi:hypothetical protein
MPLNIEKLFAPSDKQQIIIVERYNLALVAARPAALAISTGLKAGLTGANHNEIAPTTAGGKA